MKKINLITCISFLSLIFGFTILNFISPDKEFSNNENRFLASIPTFSIDSLIDGEFTADIETYIQDQFVFRDEWVMLKAISNQLLFKIENNNTYIGSDNYLLDQFILDDYEQLVQNIENINNFNGSIAIMPVVSSYVVNGEYLPFGSYNSDQLAILDYIKENTNKDYIDVYSYLKDSEDTYFKTDHHWNLNGAYLGYVAYMDYLGITPNEYTYSKVSDSFKGTTFSNSGMFFYQGDELYTVNELEDLDVTVTYENEIVTDSLFNTDRLAEKDQYTYYLDGNHSIVNIVNNEIESDEKLLVVKDSFAHIMVPYLVPHFKEIIMVDLRYYKLPISDLITNNNIDNVLLLYSIEQLTTDKNLVFLK